MSLLARRQAVVVFLAFAFAYFLSALLRAVTATLAPTLTQEFQLHARDLGLLAGGYFLGFAVTQLPLGAWLDRYGPKRVILAFLCVAVAGCAAFAVADSFHALLVARFLSGVGVSACLMAPLTGYRHWLAPETQLRANSWMLMSGSLGMLASTLPVQWLMPHTGWRPLFWGLALLVIIAMALIGWRVPAHEPEAGSTRGSEGSYAEIFRHPEFLRLCPLWFVGYGGLVAVQALWAGPWMLRVAGYTPVEAATGLFLINLSMLGTFWAWGLLTPSLESRGITAQRLIALGQPSSFAVLAVLVAAGPSAGAWTLALFCVCSTFVTLAQPAVGMLFPAALAGRALSAFNLVAFVGVFVVQWGIGLAVDAFLAAGWTEPAAFRWAMALLLLAGLFAYAWFLFGGKSHNRVQHT